MNFDCFWHLFFPMCLFVYVCMPHILCLYVLTYVWRVEWRRALRGLCRCAQTATSPKALRSDARQHRVKGRNPLNSSDSTGNLNVPTEDTPTGFDYTSATTAVAAAATAATTSGQGHKRSIKDKLATSTFDPRLTRSSVACGNKGNEEPVRGRDAESGRRGKCFPYTTAAGMVFALGLVQRILNKYADSADKTQLVVSEREI